MQELLKFQYLQRVPVHTESIQRFRLLLGGRRKSSRTGRLAEPISAGEEKWKHSDQMGFSKACTRSEYFISELLFTCCFCNKIVGEHLTRFTMA